MQPLRPLETSLIKSTFFKSSVYIFKVSAWEATNVNRCYTKCKKHGTYAQSLCSRSQWTGPHHSVLWAETVCHHSTAHTGLFPIQYGENKEHALMTSLQSKNQFYRSLLVIQVSILVTIKSVWMNFLIIRVSGLVTHDRKTRQQSWKRQV